MHHVREEEYQLLFSEMRSGAHTKGKTKGYAVSVPQAPSGGFPLIREGKWESCEMESFPRGSKFHLKSKAVE